MFSLQLGSKQTMAEGTHSSMVVSQAGAQALEALPLQLTEHLVTVGQRPGETLSELGHRVRQHVDRLSDQGRLMTRAVFVARPDFDARDVPAAADLVRVLVADMVEHGEGEVHLHTVTRCPRARYALMALADAVAEQVRGTGVSVHTCTSGASGTVRIADVKRRAVG